MTGRAVLTLALALLATAGAGLSAPYRAPRTVSGTPDLQGVWTNLSITELERPKGVTNLIATEAQVAARLSRRKAQLAGLKPPPNPKAPPGDPDDVGQTTSEFPDRDVDFLRIDGQPRTSILVEPPDGRLPYTEAGRKLEAAAEAADDHDFSGPEARLPDERCLIGPSSPEGPPMLGEPQNANYRIVQTPHEIAILSEMIHDVRIVHMGAHHPAVATHPWMGDSIGWWEGDTLVIETVDQNIGAGPRFVGPQVFYLSATAKVVERLTRISPTEIRYDFTVEDPAIYAHRLRGEMMLRATQAQIYEYACHEGNYALENILAGARAVERRAADAKN
ncbi:hypothetical protein [Phenylobacterium sp.]|uniref:hypothetical protein n=1 Tax=Phenylobacterium sp. TaxID=1871053 RepID=UPI001211211F|nr:hypothetical protein [Phenylobacterium sp.]THD57244.1 MAG: hypothetical protein E8A12_13760 [Phenylobacterium sp.]